MARKTISIDHLKIFVNSSLQYTKDENVDYRQGMITVLENALHETGNYNGFRYLDEEEMKDTGNSMPGIRRIEGTEEFTFENTDRTRVRYF